MGKISKKNIFRVICFVFVIVFLFSIPNLKLAENENLSLIYGTFVGEKSEYNGVIEVWNVDTFEGGVVSKTSILKSVAEKFQKKYKGVYVLIRNVSENECLNMLESGQKPDLFSCSYGVSDKIKQYLVPFENKSYAVYDNFLEAGKYNGCQYGLAWCSGLYFLATTKTSLEKTGIKDIDNFSLIQNAYKLGYKTSGKKSKIIYSLSMANNGVLMPQKAILAYSNLETDSLNDFAINNTKICSQYDAYVDFLVGESVLLLGSQRDVVRLSKRIENGKISDVFFEPLTKYSDLVQYLFRTHCDNQNKNSMIQKFSEFMLSDSIQSLLSNANMFSISKNIKQEFSILVFNEIDRQVLQNLALDCVLN